MLLVSVAMLTEKKKNFCFRGNHCKEKKFFHQNYAPYQSRLCLNKVVKQVRTTQKIFFLRCTFCRIAKDPDLNNGVELKQKYFFGFLYDFYLLLLDMYLRGFDLMHMSYFC